MKDLLRLKDLSRSRIIAIGAALLLVVSLAVSFMLTGHLTYAAPSMPHFASHGSLDCNGFSATGQKPFQSTTACTDPRGDRKSVV